MTLDVPVVTKSRDSSPATAPAPPFCLTPQGKASKGEVEDLPSGQIPQKGLAGALASPPHCSPAPQLLHSGPRGLPAPGFLLIFPRPQSGTQASGPPPSGPAGMEPRLSSLPAGLVPVPLCVGQGRGEGQQWRAPSHCPLPFLRKRLRLCREPQSRRGRSRHGQLEERGPGARATLRPGARAGPRAVQQTGPGLPST